MPTSMKPLKIIILCASKVLMVYEFSVSGAKIKPPSTMTVSKTGVLSTLTSNS